MLKSQIFLLLLLFLVFVLSFYFFPISYKSQLSASLISPTKWSKLLPSQLSTINIPYDSSKCIVYGHQFRIRQTGDIKYVKIFPQDFSRFKELRLQIWRNNGGNFDLINQSENLLPKLATQAGQIFELSEPVFQVKMGDYYGFLLRSNNKIFPPQFQGLNNKDVMTICNADHRTIQVNFLNYHQIPNFGPIAYLYMSPPQLISIGDSIIAGFPSNFSFLEIEEKTNLTVDPAYHLSGKLSLIYQNAGIGSESVYKIKNRFSRDVLAQHPSIVLIEGGVNDIDRHFSDYIFLNSWKSILDQTKYDQDIKKVILLGILPWTNGDDQEAKTRIKMNIQLELMSKGYPKVIFINSDQSLGQYRENGPEGNRWNLQDKYSHDGVHLTIEGNKKLADVIYKSLEEEEAKNQTNFVSHNINQMLELNY